MSSKRDIAAANETALLQGKVKPIIFARLAFATGVERFHTEIGSLTVTHPTFGSETYTGIGDFGGLSSEVVESIDGAPKGLSISLTGVRASLIDKALNDDYFRRDGDLLIALEDDSGTIVADPEWLFSGFMDKLNISLADGLATMTLFLESRATKLLSAPDFRFTDEDKQREVTGDLAAEYVYRMQDLILEWGKKTVSPNAEYDSGERPQIGSQFLR